MKQRPGISIAIGLLMVSIVLIGANHLHRQQMAEETLLRIRVMIQELEVQKARAVTHSLPGSRRVLYATEDIQMNQKISPDMIVIVDTPDDILLYGLTNDDLSTVDESYAERFIRRGEPLTELNVGLGGSEPAHGFGRVPIPKTFYEKIIDFFRR